MEGFIPYFIPYMERTRLYYRAQGFARDYKWAEHSSTPFHKLEKALPECNVTVVTTAVTHDDVPKPVRTAEHIPFEEVPDSFLTSELSWDKETTHTDDRQSYFPLEVLQKLVAEGVIGSIASRYHFVPTQYSHRLTSEEDAPAIARACIEDSVDIALLVPIWPVCHQTVSLTARALECMGIVTVVIGSAMDIVTHCYVPRYLHNDLPLGNPLGPPGDRVTQKSTIKRALQLATRSVSPVVEITDATWPGDPDWRSVYNRVDDDNRDALLAKGKENRARRAENNAQGLSR